MSLPDPGGRVLVVLHPLCAPPASSNNPGHHAHRRALENAWYQACQTHQATGTIPGWGDAICFNELHHTTPYHNTWD